MKSWSPELCPLDLDRRRLGKLPMLSFTRELENAETRQVPQPFEASEPLTLRPVESPPTVWGLTPAELHRAFWAWRGLIVVRSGTQLIPPKARHYLLVKDNDLVYFELRPISDTFSWSSANLLRLRLVRARVRNRSNVGSRGYEEALVADADDRFVAFSRRYPADEVDLAGRVAITASRRLATAWTELTRDTRCSAGRWRQLARTARERGMTTTAARTNGRVFDGDSPEAGHYVRLLAGIWRSPQVVADVHRSGQHIWLSKTAKRPPANLESVGTCWVGFQQPRDESDDDVRPTHDRLGREGPTVIFDDPDAPSTQIARLLNRSRSGRPGEATPTLAERTWQARPVRGLSSGMAKRIFDIGFALAALLATAPLWPVILFLIWWEDGRPFFYGHARQARGGVEFTCWKFRSMFNDADAIKERLIAEGKNQADGAQFFMEDDPRITRIGKLLRKTNLDELPQFWNVLRGDMSIVGPRPSPDKENQFNPTWREARLSVQPGITGLWQVRRTRSQGTDFQEWIKYDIEYVRTRTFLKDLAIVLETVVVLTRNAFRSDPLPDPHDQSDPATQSDQADQESRSP
jgi:lipopolysaccharide/colanic/teichoic acid biosynthesis glycosyltransferase